MELTNTKVKEIIKEYFKNKNKEELIPTVLLGVSVLCGILILLKVTGFFVAKAKAQSVVQRAIEQNKTDPKNVEKQLKESILKSDFAKSIELI